MVKAPGLGEIERIRFVKLGLWLERPVQSEGMSYPSAAQENAIFYFGKTTKKAVLISVH